MNNNISKEKLKLAILVPLLISVIMILVFVVEKSMKSDFTSGGIFPGAINSLWGVFTMPFIHFDIKHLANNVLTFFLLSTMLYYFYSDIANIAILSLYLLSGALLWLIGRDSWHIGASGIIYALTFFLFFSGILRRHIPLVALSLLIAFLYGSMVWYLFPIDPSSNISWEGHLSGAVSGGLLALLLRNKGPQRPRYEWENDDEEDNESAENYWNNEEEQPVENDLKNDKLNSIIGHID